MSFENTASMITDIIAEALHEAYELGVQSVQPVQPAPSRRLVTIRDTALTIPSRTWTTVRMNVIHGGDESLFNEGFINGAPGYWLFGTYLRLAANTSGQGMVRFVRDIGGEHDFTGTQDWVATPGKDFVAHTWFFSPINGKPTGIEVYQDSGSPLVLEYAQFKAAQIQP